MDRQTVIFDFDSRLFGKGATWRLQDPRLGMRGALRDSAAVFDYVRAHQEEKAFRVCDHFDHLDPGFVDSHHAEGLALLPLEHLAPTAQQHRFRGRELFLLTWTKDGGLADLVRDLMHRTFESMPGPRSRLPYQKGNPLDAAELMELRPKDLEGILGAEDLPLARFRRIRSLLSIVDGPTADRPGPYDRVFLYTSDPVLALLLDRFVLEHQDRFVAGRNALMISLIARVSEEAFLSAQKGL